MSRSYRKPILTEGYGGTARAHFKRLANRAVRRANPANGSAYKREFNSWSICDYKFDLRFGTADTWTERAKRK